MSVIPIRVAEWTADGLHQFVFPLAIHIAKGVKFVLAPLYNECVQNVTKEVGRYDVVMLEDSNFFQMFLSERFLILAPKPMGFPMVVAEEVVLANCSKTKKTTDVHMP